MRPINAVFTCANLPLVHLFVKIEELRERRPCAHLHEHICFADVAYEFRALHAYSTYLARIYFVYLTAS